MNPDECNSGNKVARQRVLILQEAVIIRQETISVLVGLCWEEQVNLPYIEYYSGAAILYYGYP